MLAQFHIGKLMRTVLDSEILLLEVVAGGEFNWRNTFMREFRGLPVDDQIPKLLWDLFLQEFKEKFGTQRPKDVLDSVHVETPPTEKEIEESWVHESASSDDARRYFGVA